jgi:hypothetical protein
LMVGAITLSDSAFITGDITRVVWCEGAQSERSK